MNILRDVVIHILIAGGFFLLGYVVSENSLKNYITGGDSYCYLKIEEQNPKTNEIVFKLIHEGEYSLYDLHINVFFSENRNEYEEKPRERFPIGNVIPNTVRNKRLNLGTANRQRIRVSYLVRNGNYEQYFWFSKIEGRWLYETYVEREGKKLNHIRSKDFAY